MICFSSTVLTLRNCKICLKGFETRQVKLQLKIVQNERNDLSIIILLFTFSLLSILYLVRSSWFHISMHLFIYWYINYHFISKLIVFYLHFPVHVKIYHWNSYFLFICIPLFFSYKKINKDLIAQPAFTYSKLTKETPEQAVKNGQS